MLRRVLIETLRPIVAAPMPHEHTRPPALDDALYLAGINNRQAEQALRRAQVGFPLTRSFRPERGEADPDER